MKKPDWLLQHSFAPIIKLPSKYYIHDFSNGEDPTESPYSVGKYNEKRQNMYNTELFKSEQRNIHMGVDIAAPVNAEVYNFFDGELIYKTNNTAEGDYGPTLVYRYQFGKNDLYALYGHLSLESLDIHPIGKKLNKGATLGFIGRSEVNGGWFPHVHFQLSLKDPGQANMPGVVSDENHSRALMDYPDPRWVLGPIF